jgi:hypothetical protein
VIANFIVIKVISDVDNIYLNGTNDTTLMKVTSGDDWRPKVVYGWVPFNERSLPNKVLFIVLKVVKILYNSLYFYFFPFLCMLLNFLSPKCSDLINPTADIDDNGMGIVKNETLCKANFEVFYIKNLFTGKFIGK